VGWLWTLPVGLRVSVAAGGMVGAGARLGLIHLFGYAGAGLLVAVALANVAGSAGVGAVMAASQRPGVPAGVWTMVATGVCGGLTTMSTVALEVARGWRGTTGVAATAYAVGSVVVCVAVVAISRRLVASRLGGHRS
jgi:CrcB protein